jgi:cell fate regulator YaaT (PSP1 superfamily)
LFQVWARDMMRIDPNAAVYSVGTDCWMAIACQWYGPLPSVEVENIAMQWLDWRDIERLKWRCWKLKCSLLYELEIYLKESKEFPERWSSVICPWWEQKGIVSSYNIITKEVVIKTEEGGVLRVPLSLLKGTKEKVKA